MIEWALAEPVERFGAMIEAGVEPGRARSLSTRPWPPTANEMEV